jgi:chromosome segregation ATPase
MKLFKGLALLGQKELDSSLSDAEKRGLNKGKRENKARIEELEKSLERKTKELEKKRNEVSDLQEINEAYREKQEEVREVARQSIENEDTSVLLNARKESLDKLEASLKDRESRLEKKETGKYQEGYADGVSDGVRKINEITAVDRENAMKVAIVAAASHTDPTTVREATNALQLTSGDTDKKSK